ncbi:MAG: hypothetical protein ACLSWV_00105 [Pygmaiobacter massiliensis]|uniref:hypothetical protein n=1 Tax=Pygmaiobacter massiliensis TaxID=1917873 RepID=UPI002A839E53|nr:hypothetical protein [Pygmaiobacter massiliensis]MDY4785535.1 hypothetical protein [Pygmaiobacter massiliensis]
MKICFIGAGVLVALGLFFFLCEITGMPTRRVSSAVRRVLKDKRKSEQSTFSNFLDRLAQPISKHFPFSEHQLEKVQQSLDSCNSKVSARLYLSQCMVRAVVLFLVAALASLVAKPVMVIALVGPLWVYDAEKKKIDKLTQDYKTEIENELAGFVHTILAELAGSRDILRMLREYIPTAGPALGKELAITVADMESGTYETALTRLGTRVNSSVMNDVVRGLIDAVRGNDVRTYFKMLGYDLKQLELKNMKLKAQKCVPKINACSVALLGSIVMLFIGVLSIYIFISSRPLY